jgi:hypothetical protein
LPRNDSLPFRPRKGKSEELTNLRNCKENEMDSLEVVEQKIRTALDTGTKVTMEVNIDDDLVEGLAEEAKRLAITPDELIAKILVDKFVKDIILEYKAEQRVLALEVVKEAEYLQVLMPELMEFGEGDMEPLFLALKEFNALDPVSLIRSCNDKETDQ